MTRSPTANPYEAAARTSKAYRIADAATAVKVTAAVAADASPELRAALARVANVHVPSDETWARVVSILAERERLATEDPWVGVAS